MSQEELCSYGCGENAKFLYKGKKCCQTHFLKCKAIIQKRLDKRNEINPITGLTGFQTTFRQIASDRKKDVDQEGNNAFTRTAKLREANKKQKIDTITGLTMDKIGAKRASETKYKKINEDGLNIHQISGIKSFNKASNTLDNETGLTIRQKQALNHSKHLRTLLPNGNTVAQEAGKKCLITKLTIDKDGLNSFERAMLKSTKMNRYKDTNILYQSNNERLFLEDLEAEYGISWLKENIKRGPYIKYIHPCGKTKIFMPDYILMNKIIFEIKSSWTYNGNGSRLDWEEINNSKIDAARKDGYIAYLLIY